MWDTGVPSFNALPHLSIRFSSWRLSYPDSLVEKSRFFGKQVWGGVTEPNQSHGEMKDYRVGRVASCTWSTWDGFGDFVEERNCLFWMTGWVKHKKVLTCLLAKVTGVAVVSANCPRCSKIVYPIYCMCVACKQPSLASMPCGRQRRVLRWETDPDSRGAGPVASLSDGY